MCWTVNVTQNSNNNEKFGLLHYFQNLHKSIHAE